MERNFRTEFWRNSTFEIYLGSNWNLLGKTVIRISKLGKDLGLEGGKVKAFHSYYSGKLPEASERENLSREKFPMGLLRPRAHWEFNHGNLARTALGELLGWGFLNWTGDGWETLKLGIGGDIFPPFPLENSLLLQNSPWEIYKGLWWFTQSGLKSPL